METIIAAIAFMVIFGFAMSFAGYCYSTAGGESEGY